MKDVPPLIIRISVVISTVILMTGLISRFHFNIYDDSYYHCCSLSESKRKKKPIKIYIHNIVLKFMLIFSLCIYRCHTSRFSEFFFLYSLLHNRYKKKKKNLISRSIISSVSDNDKRNITSFFFIEF